MTPHLQVLKAGCPLLLAAYISIHNNNPSGVSHVLLGFGIARAYRWACQSTSTALFEVALASVLYRITSSGGWWGQMPVALQLLCLAVLVNRLQDLWEKLKFAASCYICHWKIKTLRIPRSVPLLVVSAIVSPIVLAVILLSVVMAAPLLPLFGLPIFVVGFPRPRRFWPQPGIGHSPNTETVYYEKVMPELCKYLQQSFAYVHAFFPHISYFLPTFPFI